MDGAKLALEINNVRLDDTILAPVLGVDGRYLDALFAAVQRDYGSLERYVANRLSLTAAEITTVRNRLLE